MIGRKIRFKSIPPETNRADSSPKGLFESKWSAQDRTQSQIESHHSNKLKNTGSLLKLEISLMSEQKQNVFEGTGRLIIGKWVIIQKALSAPQSYYKLRLLITKVYYGKKSYKNALRIKFVVSTIIVEDSIAQASNQSEDVSTIDKYEGEMKKITVQ
ncbi:UNKNOWN [Stylonychia lemnae]|uniref:Uncharacterized protein n=1 Tax=Stylonychia lemnae TaxID=5949 RepID=A0A078A7E3_STYLE|nr:UNKNOWN [Stylonychia lemnae]|eukprot:CDW77462.1 UNKNOWN [Stylonychia lemnae]